MVEGLEVFEETISSILVDVEQVNGVREVPDEIAHLDGIGEGDEECFVSNDVKPLDLLEQEKEVQEPEDHHVKDTSHH